MWRGMTTTQVEPTETPRKSEENSQILMEEPDFHRKRSESAVFSPNIGSRARSECFRFSCLKRQKNSEIPVSRTIFGDIYLYPP